MCLAGVSSGPARAVSSKCALDNIGDIDQQGRSALLAIVFYDEAQAGGRTRPHGPFGGDAADLCPDLVAAERLEADRLQHVDAIDNKGDRRLPVDGLQNAARRRGGHHVIGNPLDLHFRPRKTGALPPHVQSHAVGHQAGEQHSRQKSVLEPFIGALKKLFRVAQGSKRWRGAGMGLPFGKRFDCVFGLEPAFEIAEIGQAAVMARNGEGEHAAERAISRCGDAGPCGGMIGARVCSPLSRARRI